MCAPAPNADRRAQRQILNELRRNRKTNSAPNNSAVFHLWSGCVVGVVFSAACAAEYVAGAGRPAEGEKTKLMVSLELGGCQRHTSLTWPSSLPSHRLVRRARRATHARIICPDFRCFEIRNNADGRYLRKRQMNWKQFLYVYSKVQMNSFPLRRKMKCGV